MPNARQDDAAPIIPFSAPGWHVRVVVRNGEPWFVAKDVCEALGLGNNRQACASLDDDEKDTVILNDGTPGNPNMLIVSESGLYALIFKSRKPEAQAFRKWITKEVIPAIRRTGGYGLGFAMRQAS